MKRFLVESARILPLLFLAGYLTLTYAIFIYGPFDWPVNNLGQVSLFVFGCISAAIVGYMLGIRPGNRTLAALPWRRFFWIGGLAQLALMTPATYLYLHLWPWQAFEMIGCQSTSYINMLASQGDIVPIRPYFSLLRGLLAPFTISVVPLAMLHWSKLRWYEVVLFTLYVLSMLGMSYLRGTDKEMGDLVMMVLALLPLIVCRAVAMRNLHPRQLMFFVGFAMIVFVAFSVQFLARKDARMNRSYPVIAAHHDGHCPLTEVKCLCKAEKLLDEGAVQPKPQQTLDPENPELVKNFEEQERLIKGNRFMEALLSEAKKNQKIARTQVVVKMKPKTNSLVTKSAEDAAAERKRQFYVNMAAAYLSQGYYGLSLAMNEPFTSTYGFGHSPLLIDKLSGPLGIDLFARSYTGKISDRWHYQQHWSTAFAWVASDVGFPGTIAVMAIFAYALAKAWRQATECTDDTSSIVYMMMLMIVFYIPANNQLLSTVDSYCATLFWLGYWLVIRYRAKKQV